MSEVKEQTVVGDTADAAVPKVEPTQDQKLPEFPPEVSELRKLQLETKNIQSEFFQKIYELEIEFQSKHEIVYEKRRAIVNGLPTADSDPALGAETPSPGIPRFWSNVFSSTLFEIQKDDRLILEHLTDVRAKNKPFAELGFILEFDFSPNEYFENETLTKEYFFTCSLGCEMVHQGPQIFKSVGCEIKWKNGKAVPSDSFFNFFRSKTETEQLPGNDETYGMANDFEMGYFIKERIIPRAVLFYNENSRNDAPLPSVDSCYSGESVSPVTSSMLPDVGSSRTGGSTTTSASTICDSEPNK